MVLEVERKCNEADFDDPDFDYVVEIREGDKICFGSGVVRNTSPIGNGLSPFQKRMTREIYPNVAPGTHNIENYTSALYPLMNRIRSTKGVGTLAGKTPRWKKSHIRTPSPGRYDIKMKWGDGRKGMAPFGVKSKLRQMRINNYPGPPTYDLRKTSKCRRTRFMYNFGKPTLIHAVETICIAIPLDTCHKCNKLCEGDYWHKDYTLILCHLCWEEEKRTREIYNEKQLKEFKKIRNCSFMHDHEETSAAVRILPQNKITKKIRLENYLSLYIDC